MITKALAENIAMHCSEANILAGNPVCSGLMLKASEAIRTLLAEDEQVRLQAKQLLTSIASTRLHMPDLPVCIARSSANSTLDEAADFARLVLSLKVKE